MREKIQCVWLPLSALSLCQAPRALRPEATAVCAE